jgi:preprotein translocase subunit YajC
MSFFQNVETQPGTQAPSGAPQSGSAPAPAGGMLTMLLPFVILVPFLFLSFRRQKKEQQARSSLKKGDRVVTTAGLIGELMELDERIGKVKIAPGTTVQVLASALSPFDAAGDKAKTDKELADLKDAKAASVVESKK